MSEQAEWSKKKTAECQRQAVLVGNYAGKWVMTE
jgi:hypothetical protein